MKFSKFSGWIKQVRTDNLEEEQVKLLNLGFPGFAPLKEYSAEGNDQIDAMEQMGFDIIYAPLDNPRRFAGDEGLSRGRYHSIAKSQSGDDDLCLVNELKAYRNKDFGHIDVLDSANKNHFDLLNTILHFTPRERHIYIIFSDTRLIKEIPELSHLEFELDEKTSRIFWIPYDTHYEVIENCIDLRLPKTRNWFFDTFKKGDGKYFEKPMASEIMSFLFMLPTLMSQEIGGGPFTTTGAAVRGIGDWMRLNYIPALIYPSARSDAGVTIQNGRLIKFIGFNLVKYINGALPMLADKAMAFKITDLSDWHKGFPSGIHIRVPPAELNEYEGSFQVIGVEDYNEKSYNVMLKNKENGR